MFSSLGVCCASCGGDGDPGLVGRTRTCHMRWTEPAENPKVELIEIKSLQPQLHQGRRNMYFALSLFQECNPESCA